MFQKISIIEGPITNQRPTLHTKTHTHACWTTWESSCWLKIRGTQCFFSPSSTEAVAADFSGPLSKDQDRHRHLLNCCHGERSIRPCYSHSPSSRSPSLSLSLALSLSLSLFLSHSFLSVGTLALIIPVSSFGFLLRLDLDIWRIMFVCQEDDEKHIIYININRL